MKPQQEIKLEPIDDEELKNGPCEIIDTNLNSMVNQGSNPRKIKKTAPKQKSLTIALYVH